jgi:hypothetical protein
VGSNPEPHDADWRVDAEGAMRGADANRPEATDAFEMERRMTGVRLQDLVVGAGQSLQVSFEIVEMSPEPA